MVLVGAGLLVATLVRAADEQPAPVPVSGQPPAAIGGRVKGTVTGLSRQPVVGARVVASVRLADRDGLFLTTSDDHGTYVYQGLPAGQYRIDAHAERYVAGSFLEVDVHPPFRNILDFRLQFRGAPDGLIQPPAASRQVPSGPPVAVSGNVWADDHRPVPEAEITLEGGPDPGRRLVLSRADGAFSMANVVPDSYTVVVTAAGSLPIRIPGVAITSGRPLDIQVSLVDFPVRLAVQESVILPDEAPLPPRQWWQVPESPSVPPDPAAPQAPPPA